MNKRRTSVSAERAAELLAYDPVTGVLRWKKPTRNGLQAGSVAGCVNRLGYRRVVIDGLQYPAHRIAWLLTHGRWPVDRIDHIDGNPTNNSLSNLREATHAQNVQNQKRRADNKSGFKGVCWKPSLRKWAATITVDRHQKHLGFFDSPAAAYAAYCAAAAEFHGEFARIA